jgi:hypothetical protein
VERLRHLVEVDLDRHQLCAPLDPSQARRLDEEVDQDVTARHVLSCASGRASVVPTLLRPSLGGGVVPTLLSSSSTPGIVDEHEAAGAESGQRTLDRE